MMRKPCCMLLSSFSACSDVWLIILPILQKLLCMQAGAKEVLQAIMDTGVENVTTDRAKFALTWLTVGADQDDFKAPKGDKTFEGNLQKATFCGLHT